MAKKTLPPFFSSWRHLYDDIVAKHPEALKKRQIVFKWMNPYTGNPTEFVEPYIFSIYIDTLKKKCFEESMGKL